MASVYIKKKKAQRRRNPAESSSNSAPIAIMASGILGGYAAMVMLPAVGINAFAQWQIAMVATIVVVLGAIWAVYNCLPLATTPTRGRLVAAVGVLACLGAVAFTYKLHAHETTGVTIDSTQELAPPAGDDEAKG